MRRIGIKRNFLMDKIAAEHIFFDLDLTLWDFVSNSREALEQILSERNLIGYRGITPENFIRIYRQINVRLWEDYGQGRITKQTLRTERFSRVFHAFSIRDADLIEAVAEDYVRISPYKKNLMPYARQTLEYLSRRYPISLITNGFEDTQHIKVEQSGLRPYLKEIITSEMAGAKKPSPEIFEFACRKTGAEPCRCVMVGDDFSNDIEGAEKAGMRAVYFNPENRPLPQGYSGGALSIRSLKELEEIL